MAALSNAIVASQSAVTPNATAPGRIGQSNAA
jgi:hypothetical protein